MAEAYGVGGREAYIKARFTFDLIWPVVYTFFLTVSISWLFSRAFDPDSFWRRLNLVPVFAMAFDYLENISSSLIMLRYPQETPVVVTLAPIFTMLKWILISGSIILLLLGVIFGIWQWIRN
jgi:cellulose synthase/poly-beta-1,6-N-acetylglucosamine synthase-like glycosyltransferase